MKKNVSLALFLAFLILLTMILSGCKKTPDVTATNTTQVEATAEAAVAELEKCVRRCTDRGARAAAGITARGAGEKSNDRCKGYSTHKFKYFHPDDPRTGVEP